MVIKVKHRWPVKHRGLPKEEIYADTEQTCVLGDIGDVPKRKRKDFTSLITGPVEWLGT